MRLEKHEAVCAERYDAMMKMLERNTEEIRSLSRVASMGMGAWKMVLGVGTVLSIL